MGGCYGIGAIYPIARALKQVGNTILTAAEARSKYMLYWQEKLSSVSDKFYPVTRDGSKGIKGHVTDAIDIILKEAGGIDKVIAIGCPFMMMIVSEHTKPLGIKTMVNLNPIMVDGTGMCGACRVQVKGETKFACVDGPEFDGHDVDWELLFQRRHAYSFEELNRFNVFEEEI
jgi:ferredoxin--NADP+ reductase